MGISLQGWEVTAPGLSPTAPAQTHQGAAPGGAQFIPLPEPPTGRGLGQQQSHFPGAPIQLKGL